MNNAKVTVTMEVAEAIEVLRSSVGGHNLNEYGIITYLGDEAQRRAYPELNVLYSHYLGEGAIGFPLDLMQALVNGYTVEKSPEDKVREYYDRCHANMRLCYATNRVNDAHLNNGQAIGASITLDILGIKIEGVNA